MQLLRSYLAARGRQGGVTLVELMIVLVIISIIGLVSVGIMVSLFDSNIRAGQYLSQQTTIETYYGFMASRLAPTQRGKVGLPYCQPLNGASASSVCVEKQWNTTSGDRQINTRCTEAAQEAGNCRTIVDPLTIAGDQLVFQSNGYCYRVFYDEGRREIRAAVERGCTDLTIPRRGPSEPGPGNGGTADATLDDLTKSFALASRVVKDRPRNASADAPQELELFRYYNPEDKLDESPGAPLNEIPGKAASNLRGETAGNLPSFYDKSANRGMIGFIKGFAYVAGTDSDEARPRIQDRFYSQVFALNQICDVEGEDEDAAGVTPGTLLDSGIDDLGGGPNGNVTNGGEELFRLRTATAGQPRLVEFTAQAGISGAANPVALTAILEKLDGPNNWVEESDLTGRSRFVAEQAFPGLSLNGPVILAGAFKLPAASGVEGQLDWRVRVEISGPGGHYSKDPERTFFSYRVTADNR